MAEDRIWIGLMDGRKGPRAPSRLQGAVAGAIRDLSAAGHIVEMAAGIPGLYHIDGGPEITIGQLLHVAEQLAGPRL